MRKFTYRALCRFYGNEHNLASACEWKLWQIGFVKTTEICVKQCECINFVPQQDGTCVCHFNQTHAIY